jgi:spore germination protein GerM
MTRRRIWMFAVIYMLVFLTVIVSIAVVRRRAQPGSVASSGSGSSTAPTAPGRKINARLYYVSNDGTKLTGVDREVSYADGAAGQAQEIVSAQIAPVPAPLVSAIPAGTALRALYVDGKGGAFVDLSGEASVAHTGGSQDELLTIYSIVNALTANLPAITSVQLLVDGKEVDTLAGHIDLRKPLQRNLAIIEPEAPTPR